MAARSLRRSKGLRPEQVVEAALKDVPATKPVLEILSCTVPRLLSDLGPHDLGLDLDELEAQLRNAGFDLHGTRGGRRSARAAPLQDLARALARAVTAKQLVFWVGTEAGPDLPNGALDTQQLAEAGLGGPGAVLNVGEPEAVPGLVAAALLAWRRGPGRRVATQRAWLVTGGAEDRFAPKTWQRTLQRVADDAQLTLHVRHLPAGVTRWARPRASLASVHTVASGGASLITQVSRILVRRPGRAARPLRVEVADATPVSGRISVAPEGRPASRRYVVQPRR